MIRRIAVLALAVLAVSACSFNAYVQVGAPPSDKASSTAGLRFVYTSVGQDNSINQTLTIYNDRPGESAVPTVEIQPLDGNNQPLPGLTVESLFGITRGELLVLPAGGYDILKFSGGGSGDVRNVSVIVVSVKWTPDSRSQVYEPALQFLASDGSELTKFDDFTSVVVTNHNDFEIKAAILYIVWTDPSLPGPQQARLTASFPGPITLAANGTTTVPAGAEVQSVMAQRGDQAAVSVKIYPVP